MAEVTVTVPRLLADLVGGARHQAVDARTAGEALDELCRTHPGLRTHIFDGSTVRTHVNVFVNGEMLSRHEPLDRPVVAGDDVAVVPAVSGGQR